MIVVHARVHWWGFGGARPRLRAGVDQRGVGCIAVAAPIAGSQSHARYRSVGPPLRLAVTDPDATVSAQSK